MFFRERLRADHDLGEFSCGNPLLDGWLIGAAFNADRSGTGRTYVWTSETGRVVAYFTLAPHVIRRAGVPARVGRGAPDAIPSVLIARLALDRTLHGRGLGAALLADALAVTLDPMRTAGGLLIVVDAIDERAADFYERHGFLRIRENPACLVMKAGSAARSLGVAWP